MAEETEKSDVGAADLLKAIEAYETVESAISESGTSRETYLTARLDSNTITKSERAELGRLWAQVEDAEPELPNFQKSFVETIGEDDDTSQMVDASPFLKSLVDGIDTQMGRVLQEMGRDGRATRELLRGQGTLIKGLGRVVVEQDDLIKSLVDRLEHVESTPVGRRSVRTATPPERRISKSMVGEADDNLSKSQVGGALRTLMIAASERNDQQAMEQIKFETAAWEQTGALKPSMLAAVNEVVRTA